MPFAPNATGRDKEDGTGASPEEKVAGQKSDLGEVSREE